MLYRRKRIGFWAAAVAAVCLLVGRSVVAETSVIRLATTTSTESSGLLAHLLPAFEKASGYTVHVIAVGTGKALRMGRDGDVDVVLVHARRAEEAFVAAGHGVERRDVMYNDFVVVGPRQDPAKIRTSASAAEALSRIAAGSHLFISRGDASGTHEREQHLWQKAGLAPAGSWYREAGQGMGKVLQMADELNAYTLSDRGTWLAYRTRSRLALLYQGDPALFNPYGIIAVNPQRYPDANYPGAQALTAWLTSPGGKAAIAAFALDGERAFVPAVITTGAREE